LIGADQVSQFPKWRDPIAILQEADVLVVARPDFAFDFESLPKPLRVLRDRVVKAPQLPISSTEIRRRIRAGESVTGLVPVSVEAHIRQRGLYR
jgi:nicotinate-nucleotide adenylyltransferase